MLLNAITSEQQLNYILHQYEQIEEEMKQNPEFANFQYKIPKYISTLSYISKALLIFSLIFLPIKLFLLKQPLLVHGFLSSDLRVLFLLDLAAAFFFLFRYYAKRQLKVHAFAEHLDLKKTKTSV